MEPEAGAGRAGGILRLTGLALVVGVVVGLVGAAFRAALDAADRGRDAAIVWAHGLGVGGFVLVVGACGGAVWLAAWLVRRFSPHASGSGIPHVTAVLQDGLPPAPAGLAGVKFAGGVLAIGAGLALGREGPTVQMGASLAVAVGRVFRRPWVECRALLAAGAGAGLAAAFNAPLAGAAFVLEELVGRFETRLTVAALAASAMAIAVVRLLLGDGLVFEVAAVPEMAAGAMPVFVVFGALMGLAGVVYNRTLLATMAAVEAVRLPMEMRGAVIGAGVGVLAFVSPGLVGGGHEIAQAALAGGPGVPMALLILVVRFGLSPLCYATNVPGGIFTPLLAIGALLGLVYGAVCHWVLPGLGVPTVSFAVVGMAAFLVGVTRSPLTGMVLVSEMTGGVTLLLPMLGACALAMAVPTALGDAPIYASLRASLLRRERGGDGASDDSPGLRRMG